MHPPAAVVALALPARPTAAQASEPHVVHFSSVADSGDGWSAKPVAIPARTLLDVHLVAVGEGDAMWIHTHDEDVPGTASSQYRRCVQAAWDPRCRTS